MAESENPNIRKSHLMVRICPHLPVKQGSPTVPFTAIKYLHIYNEHLHTFVASHLLCETLVMLSCIKAQQSSTTSPPFHTYTHGATPSPHAQHHWDDSGSLSLVDKDSLSGHDVTAAFLLEANLCPAEQQENLCAASQSSHVLGRRRTASAAVLCRHVTFPSDFPLPH